MDFLFEPEHNALRDVTRKALSASDDPWGSLSNLGVLALPYPEAIGGAGASAVEVMLVAQEIGRAQARVPFVESSVIAASILTEVDAPNLLLSEVLSGSRVAVLAHDEPRSRWAREARALSAVAGADGWVLTGLKEPVPWGGRADTLLVTAATDEGTQLFLVEPELPSITRTVHTTIDGSQVARIDFNRAPATLLAGPTQTTKLLAEVEVRAIAAYSAEALGAMEDALDLTTEYLKTRHQFGVPLKTFQALTHRAADMYVALELARSLVLYAAMSLADGDIDPTTASRLKVRISRSGRLIGTDAIQLHGGVGVTSEFGVGHHTARLEVIEHLWGDGRHHLARLAADLSTEPVDFLV